MGQRLLLVFLISFLVLSQQVFTSKKFKNCWNEWNEEEEYLSAVLDVVSDEIDENIESSSYVNRKRKSYNNNICNSAYDFQDDSENNLQKRQKNNNFSDKKQFDFEDFEGQLFFYSRFNLNLFGNYIYNLVSEFPEMAEDIIKTVLKFEDCGLILVLFQEGYEISFEAESEKKKILKKAFEQENRELISFLLETVENPLEYSIELSPSLSVLELIKSMKKPVVNEEEFIKRVSDYQKMNLNRFIRNSDTYRMETSRSTVFLNAYQMVIKHKDWWYGGYLRPFIVFEGETGVDHGGLLNEWLEILIESFIKPDPGRKLNQNFYKNIQQSSSSSRNSVVDGVFDFTEAFFIETTKGIYVPNTKYSAEIFKFIGSFYALAFILDIPLGIEFLPAFYRTLTEHKLDNLEASAESELKFIDEELFKGLDSLRKIKNFESFSVNYLNNEVTSENLEEYISQQAQHFTESKYKQHLESLKEGFFSIIEKESFNRPNLSNEELHKIMLGNVVLSAEDFSKHVNVTRFDLNSRKWIFEIIEEFNDRERLLLFKFITARRSVPFKGLKNLSVPISFASVYLPDADHLPTASTCGSLLKIPIYPKKEILKEKLLMAINSCETFDLE